MSCATASSITSWQASWWLASMGTKFNAEFDNRPNVRWLYRKVWSFSTDVMIPPSAYITSQFPSLPGLSYMHGLRYAIGWNVSMYTIIGRGLLIIMVEIPTCRWKSLSFSLPVGYSLHLYICIRMPRPFHDAIQVGGPWCVFKAKYKYDMEALL